MAGFLPPALLEQIRAANDIVEVVGGYVPLKRAGANFVALCPFHKEKSPSFNVNPQRQIFHCFGCHKGGDVFAFVKEYENIGFMDAVRRLAERARIPLEFDQQPGQEQARHIKDQLLHLHEQITQRWQAALQNEVAGQIARDYLQKRGVSAEAVKLFRIGCAPDLWDDTVNWAKSKGHELALAEKAGLILRKEGSDHFYDRFRGRLIFPICDEQGRVVAFSGRILAGDEKTAKYVNSPETPIFTKGRIFFGLDKSKRALLDARAAILCEGQLDLIACFMAGIKNIVAPQGTALTADHARLLKRYVDEVILCFDSDAAGQNATVRSLDSLLAAGLAVRVAVVPAPHDPDTFIKENGGAAFQKVIDEAAGFFDWYLGRLCATHDVNTDKGRLAVVQAMRESVQKTNNAVLFDAYAQKTAIRLGVSADAVRKEFRKRLPSSTVKSEEDEEDLNNESSISPEERSLLKVLFEKEETLAWAEKNLDLDWVDNQVVREVITRRLEHYRSGAWTDVPSFLNEISSMAAKVLTEVLISDPVRHGDGTKHLLKRSQINPLDELSGTVNSMRRKSMERRLASIAKRIDQGELTDEETVDLLTEKVRLHSMLKNPSIPPTRV